MLQLAVVKHDASGRQVVDHLRARRVEPFRDLVVILPVRAKVAPGYHLQGAIVAADVIEGQPAGDHVGRSALLGQVVLVPEQSRAATGRLVEQGGFQEAMFGPIRSSTTSRKLAPAPAHWSLDWPVRPSCESHRARLTGRVG